MTKKYFTSFSIQKFIPFICFEKGGRSLCLWGFLCPNCLDLQGFYYSSDLNRSSSENPLTESQFERYPPWSCRDIDRSNYWRRVVRIPLSGESFWNILSFPLFERCFFFIFSWILVSSVLFVRLEQRCVVCEIDRERWKKQQTNVQPWSCHAFGCAQIVASFLSIVSIFKSTRNHHCHYKLVDLNNSTPNCHVQNVFKSTSL